MSFSIASSISSPHIDSPPVYFRSRRIRKGEVEKPWLEIKHPQDRIIKWIPYVGMFVGVVAAALIIWDGLRSAIRTGPFCTVYSDDFSSGTLNPSIWEQEVEVGGFGNGQFEMTTATGENVFVKDGILVIKPTLQDESLIASDNVINLLQTGTCTGTSWSQCVTSTNTTNGTIVNPAKSGRINTRKGASIQYGRVEVVAKLPAGDWLWPAIWMLPKDSVYGAWPQSGEIDIVESRGNNHTYSLGGNNIVSSALHWGPDPVSDAWWRTNYRKPALHSTFSDQFHTFGMDWTDKYLFTWIDSKLLQIGYTKFKEPLWQKGEFAFNEKNGSAYVDPWSQTGSASTPFDQQFYLVLNVAVGGTNGWFADKDGGSAGGTGRDGKPWINTDVYAPIRFWDARDQWYPTWQKGGQMEIQSVKMMQLSGFAGCKA